MHPTLTRYVARNCLKDDVESRATRHRQCMKELNAVVAVFWALAIVGSVFAYFSYFA